MAAREEQRRRGMIADLLRVVLVGPRPPDETEAAWLSRAQAAGRVVAETLGLPPRTMRSWVGGQRTPSPLSAQMLRRAARMGMIRTHPPEPGMAGIDAMQLLVSACRWAADIRQGVEMGPSVDDGEWWDTLSGPDAPVEMWRAAGTCLRVARARAGLSSDALGERVGVSGQRIRQLEGGDPARPPAALVARIYGQLPWLDPAARILWAAAERRTPLGGALDRAGDDGVAVRELAARIYWDGEPDAETLQRLADAVEALGAEREGGPLAADTDEVVALARWSGPELTALARWLRGGGTAR